MFPVTAISLALLLASVTAAPALLEPQHVREAATSELRRPDPHPRPLRLPIETTMLTRSTQIRAPHLRRRSGDQPHAAPAHHSPFASRSQSNAPALPSIPTLSRARKGLTMDTCTTTSNCIGTRKCMVGFVEDAKPCNNEDNCVCLPPSPPSCKKSEECDADEVCAVYGLAGKFCVSEAAVDSYSTLTEVGDEPVATPEEDGADRPAQAGQPTEVQDLPSGLCIAVDALRQFDAKDLVFERHTLANVLCDVKGSCATPGHMVLFRGKAMMMKSYCNMMTCEKRVMQVNSPTYRRRMVIESKTEGLAFTVFAAKYETRSEEAIIAVAVRLGM